MVDIAILCPIEVEFEIALKRLAFSSIKETRLGSISYVLGIIETRDQNWKIALIEPSTKEADFHLDAYEAISTLKPKYVFLLGVAGGVKDASIGDLVISTQAYNYESGKETSEGFASRPKSRFNSSNELIQLAKRVRRKIVGQHPAYEIYFGPIVSGGKVITDTKSQTYRIIKKHYEDTLAVEKEAYAFAVIAQKLKIPYLNIRGISDLLDNKKEADEGGSQVLAAGRAADFLRSLILKLPALPISKTIKQEIKINVFYLEEPSGILHIRGFRKAEFVLQNKHFVLQTNNKTNISGKIKAVEKVKMPGDFGKAWIKIHYTSLKEENASLYISKHSLIPGLGFIFGNGSTLLKQLAEVV